MLENHMTLLLPEDDIDLFETLSDLEIRCLDGEDDYAAVLDEYMDDWRGRDLDAIDRFDVEKQDGESILYDIIVRLYKAKELPSQQVTTRDMLTETLTEIGSGFSERSFLLRRQAD